jgi:hypothetical protein
VTPLEELLRSTLQDPARELPPDPGTIDAALGRVSRLRRRRLAITSAAAACLVTLSAGILISGLDARRDGTTGGGDQRPVPMPAVTGSQAPDDVRNIWLPEAGVAALAMDSAAVYVLNRSRVLRVERVSGRIVRQRALPDEPAALALGPADTLWLTTTGQQPGSYALLQLDRRTLAVRRTLHLDDPPVALAVAGPTLWAGGYSTLYRLDAADGRVRGRLHHQESSVSLAVDPTQRFLYVSLAEERDGILIARDARTGSELARRNFHARSLVPGGSLWIADLDAGHVATVHRLDPRTLADRELGEVRPLRDEGLALWPGGAGVLWITDATRGTLACVDAGSAWVRGVRMFDATGLLVADAAGLYAATGQGLTQVAPSSVCGG